MKKFKELKMELEYQNCYQPLFNLFAEDYHLHPLRDEMDMIMKAAKETENKIEEWEKKYSELVLWTFGGRHGN